MKKQPENPADPVLTPATVLGGDAGRHEVAGCPTGLSDLGPVRPPEAPPQPEPPAVPKLDVEHLPERDEETKLDEDLP